MRSQYPTVVERPQIPRGDERGDEYNCRKKIQANVGREDHTIEMDEIEVKLRPFSWVSFQPESCVGSVPIL